MKKNTVRMSITRIARRFFAPRWRELERHENKAEELQRHLKILNSHDREGIRYEGGIVRKENAMWYCNSRDEYQYRQGSTEGWKNMNDIFNR